MPIKNQNHRHELLTFINGNKTFSKAKFSEKKKFHFLRIINEIAEDTTFFEYAYEKKKFELCDYCISFWFNFIEQKQKILLLREFPSLMGEKFMNLMSVITQPPHHEIIQEPVFVQYIAQNKYDYTTFYEKDVVQKIIDVNKEPCKVESADMAHDMTADEFEELSEGDHVVIQIDEYDAFFMNTIIMTNAHVKNFIQDGEYRHQTNSIGDIFPYNKSRRCSNGVHFIGTENASRVPTRLYNFERFENELIYQTLGHLMWDDKTFDELVEIHRTFSYNRPVVSRNDIAIICQFEADDEIYSIEFTLAYDPNLDDDKKADFRVVVRKCGMQLRLFDRTYHILMFSGSSASRTLSNILINQHLNDEYLHDLERIVRKATVKEKLLSADGSAIVAICNDTGEEIVCTENAITLHHTNAGNRRVAFRTTMEVMNRHILVQEESYALRNVKIGLYTIPSTNYVQNQVRLSNGKRPKKMKDAKEGSRKITMSKKIKEVKEFKEDLDKVFQSFKKKDVVIDNIDELHAMCYPLLQSDKLLEFHDIINSVPPAMKNNFIMKMRGNVKIFQLNYTFNQLYRCIMNKKACHDLLDKETIAQKWMSYFSSKGSVHRPALHLFDVIINDLDVSFYIKNKLNEKLRTKKMKITPLILCILLKYDIEDDILNHDRMIQVTDYRFYPIHFVLHFCDDAKKRIEYTQKLFFAEKTVNTTSNNELFVTTIKKWTLTNADEFVIALFEWPFDKLIQTFFMLNISSKEYLLKDRYWKIQMINMYSYIPGTGLMKHLQQRYGQPEDYIASWEGGIEWFYDVGFVWDKKIKNTIATRLRNKTFTGTDDNHKALLHFHQIYAEKQYHNYQTIISKLKGGSCDTKDIFLDKDVNIHFASSMFHFTNTTSIQSSIFHHMITTPNLWDDDKFLSTSKILMHYFDMKPTLIDSFETLSHKYIDVKLSLFAQTQLPTGTFVKRRRRNQPCTYTTILCRNGGSEKQLKFVFDLLRNVNTKFQYYGYKDLHDILSPHTSIDLLNSLYFSQHYRIETRNLSSAAVKYPFLVDNIINLFCDLDVIIDDVVLEKRIELLVAYIKVYGKGCDYEHIGKFIKTDADDLMFTCEQSRYINIIQRIRGLLIDVLKYYKKHFGRYDYQSTFYKILSSEKWKDTYIADIMRFEHLFILGGASFFSYVCILTGDLNLGLVWWKNWSQQMDSHDELGKEIFRIFNSKDLCSSNMLPSIVYFINKYISINIGDVIIITSWKKRAISKDSCLRDNYLFLGSLFAEAIQEYEPSGDTIIDEAFYKQLDELMYQIIIHTHIDTTMGLAYKHQSLYFLNELVPRNYLSTIPHHPENRANILFNGVIEILTKCRLSRSILLFLESFEKHFDYLHIRQHVSNIVKTSSFSHIMINDFMKQFMLSPTNRAFFEKIHSAPFPILKKWVSVVTKLHHMGLFKWETFKMNVVNLHHFQSLHDDHEKILMNIEKGEPFTFLSSSSYSIPFFVQNNVNPFLIKNVTCLDMPSLTWRQHLFYTMSKLRGWPMKIYFPYMENTFIDQLPIDDNFTLNDDIPGFYDYRDLLSNNNDYYTKIKGKKRIIEGRFILEAQTIIMQTLINDKSYNLKTLKGIVEDYENFCLIKDNLHYERIWTIQHGVVKSQLSNCENTIIHAKVDLISFATLYCNDLTALKMKKLFNTVDLSNSTLESKIEFVSLTKDEPQRIHFLSTYIVDVMTSSVYFLLQFCDNIKFFDVCFKRLELFCLRLKLSPTLLFHGDVVSIKTGHAFKDGSMVYYANDILTFCAYYGRTMHLKYLLNYLDNLRETKQYNLESLYTRTDKCNLLHPFQKKYSSDCSPYEHLLWCAISKGHVKSFSHIIHHVPNSELMNINWKSLMLVCVKLVKFDPSKYKELQATMQRKRDILKKIFNLKKLKVVHKNLEVGIDYCVKYLSGFRKQIIKVADYFSFFKPAFKTCSRVLMRNELTAWGNHIFCCLDTFENFNSRVFQFDGKTILNCTVFYSSDLFQFVADRYLKEPDERNIEYVQKHVISADQLLMIQNVFTEEEEDENQWPIQFRIILLLHILRMETKNTNIHVQELISSGYLKHVFDKLFPNITKVRMFLGNVVETDIHKDFMEFLSERERTIEI